MLKRACAILLITVSVTGCAFTGHKSVSTQQYQLLAPPSPGGASTPAHHFHVVLQVGRPKAPGWLNKANIYYQLAYKEQSRISAYAHSRWVQPAPAMLGHSLEQQLADTQAFQAITQSGAGVTADLALRVKLSDFVQRFMSRENSFGVLNGRATLVDLKTDRLLGQHQFRYRVAAPTADAVGGVRALGVASGKFTNAVSKWVQKTLAQCAPKCVQQAGK